MKNIKQLIEKIDEAILVEEMALPIYTQHLNTAMFWSGLPEEKSQMIKDGMEKLFVDSKHHVMILNKVKKILQKG